MARIAGVDIPNNKRVEIARPTSTASVARAPTISWQPPGSIPIPVPRIDRDEIAKLRDEIERNYHVEGDLRREVSMNIKNLVEINCYTGIRHRKGLPVEVSAPRPTQEQEKPAKTIANKKK